MPTPNGAGVPSPGTTVPDVLRTIRKGDVLNTLGADEFAAAVRP